MPVGNRIRCDFQRPDPSLVEAFRGLPAANIDDCMSRMAALDPTLRPLNKSPLLGTAFPIRLPAGDNLMLHKAMDLAQPGDVLVIDAGGCCDRATMGGLMSRYCLSRGLAGLIVNGAIRDCQELSTLSIPVYAKGVSPNGPYKNGPGEIGFAVSIGGQVIYPGDILIGDADGIVVVRPEEAAEVAAAARAVYEKEEKILAEILNRGTYIRPWVDEKLRETLCEF